jgi:inner membrane protein
VIPGNPRLRLSTNSPAEYFILGILVIILIISLYINNIGSIITAFNQVMGIPSAAIEEIQVELTDYLLIAQVQGYNTLTKQKIDQNFEVVDLVSLTEFIGKDDAKLYKIGNSTNSNIIANKIRIKKEKPITYSNQEIRLEEDLLLDYLEDINDNGRTYISGIIKVEDPDFLEIPETIDYYNPINIIRMDQDYATIQLTSSPVDYVREYLSDFISTGTIVVKTVE